MARISRRTFLAALAAGAVAAGCAWHDGRRLDATRLPIPLARLPRAFDGFTICHLSDLHQAGYGHNHEELVAAIRAAGPDLIAMTGDMVDRSDNDESPFLALCDQLPGIAPTYYVTGNHDVVRGHRGIGERVARRGVHFMDNRHTVIERDGERFWLAGAGEWNLYGQNGVLRAMEGIPDKVFTVLLAHHPAFIPLYAGAGVDLVLSGHTHGGQVRIPFLGAVIAPDQGLFPQYAAGLYRFGKTALYISRGLGESLLPIRLNCPREIAYLTLRSAT